MNEEVVQTNLPIVHSSALLLADQQTQQGHVTGEQLKHVAAWETPSNDEIWTCSTTYTGFSKLNCFSFAALYTEMYKLLYAKKCCKANMPNVSTLKENTIRMENSNKLNKVNIW